MPPSADTWTFPRTPQQQSDYVRQKQEYNARALLLNTVAVMPLQRAKYLATKMVGMTKVETAEQDEFNVTMSV